VVFAGGIDVQGGTFRVNSGSTTDRVVYVRNGSITKDAQGSLELQRVFVYLRNGRISLGAGSGGVTWIAPFGGDFEDLSLWSESTLEHDLGGQASLQLDGVFFTPNAHVQFTGQGNFAQLQARTGDATRSEPHRADPDRGRATDPLTRRRAGAVTCRASRVAVGDRRATPVPVSVAQA
jgi:hypothetical protein